MNEHTQQEIKKIARTLAKEGTERTATGRWSFGFDEIRERYGLDLSADHDGGRRLAEELQQEEEVNELIMLEDHIEISYHLAYCPACNQGGVSGVMNLFSLMGCNLYDVHLCHDEEEHELATITELNQNTLTEEGKAAWADVLAAKVTRLYEGAYGFQVELSGCSAKRLSDFSYMLAGYCSAKDYERWVMDEGGSCAHEETNGQEQAMP